MGFSFIEMSESGDIEEGELLKPRHFDGACDLTEYKESNVKQTSGQNIPQENNKKKL